jgi:hypothetical protein
MDIARCRRHFLCSRGTGLRVSTPDLNHTSTSKLKINSCFNNRRRRKQGRVPYRGTGWLGGRPAQATGTTNEPDYNNAGGAPNYNQGNQGYDGGGGGAGGANSDYYGQQNGVELQAPAPTYGGGNGYAPPPGPPPPGKDAVIR